MKKFRRPAMLDPQQADNLVGEDDIAISLGLAHDTAAALLHSNPGNVEEENFRQGVLRVLAQEGPDLVSELWDKAPADSLPGVLWRLYLLREWMRREPRQVEEFWECWSVPSDLLQQKLSALPHMLQPLEPTDIYGKIDDLLLGNISTDLADLLAEVVVFLQALALTRAQQASWIKDDKHALAFTITRRAAAIWKTAEEIHVARNLALQGRIV